MLHAKEEQGTVLTPGSEGKGTFGLLRVFSALGLPQSDALGLQPGTALTCFEASPTVNLATHTEGVRARYSRPRRE